MHMKLTNLSVRLSKLAALTGANFPQHLAYTISYTIQEFKSCNPEITDPHRWMWQCFNATQFNEAQGQTVYILNGNIPM